MVQVYISKSIEGNLKIQLSCLDCCQNFAKSSSGSLPLWLQHKLGPKLLLKNTGFWCPIFKNFPFSLCFKTTAQINLRKKIHVFLRSNFLLKVDERIAPYKKEP
jgi:hypothetical protein